MELALQFASIADAIDQQTTQQLKEFKTQSLITQGERAGGISCNINHFLKNLEDNERSDKEIIFTCCYIEKKIGIYNEKCFEESSGKPFKNHEEKFCYWSNEKRLSKSTKLKESLSIYSEYFKVIIFEKM